MKSKLWILVAILVTLSMLLVACGGGDEEKAEATSPPAEEQPTEPSPTEQPSEGGFAIPATEEGKFNVAMVLIGPHDDGGWSQAHYEGLVYVEENVPNVHVAYIENVPEGAESEQVFRSLSRKGFDLIFGTSFGYMDAMELLADEFPNITYIHISGYKSNMGTLGTCLARWKT
jgi:basic membrane protein A